MSVCLYVCLFVGLYVCLCFLSTIMTTCCYLTPCSRFRFKFAFQSPNKYSTESQTLCLLVYVCVSLFDCLRVLPNCPLVLLPSVCLPPCLSFCLPVSICEWVMDACVFVNASVYLIGYMCVCLSLCVSVYVFKSVCLSSDCFLWIHSRNLSLSLFVHLCRYLSLSLCVCVCMFVNAPLYAFALLSLRVIFISSAIPTMASIVSLVYLLSKTVGVLCLSVWVSVCLSACLSVCLTRSLISISSAENSWRLLESLLNTKLITKSHIFRCRLLSTS